MLGITKLSVLIFVATMLLITGCSSPGRHLEPALVGQIREGVTTRQEVEKQFGQPRNTMNGSNRRTLVIYEYGQLKPNAEPASASVLPTPMGTVWLRTLSILYDERNTVEKALFYQSTTPYERNMSSISAGNVVGEKELASIKTGETTASDLRKSFGSPMSKTLNVDGELVLGWFYGKAAGRFEPSSKRQTLLVRVDAADVVRDYVVAGNLTPTPETK